MRKDGKSKWLTAREDKVNAKVRKHFCDFVRFIILSFCLFIPCLTSSLAIVQQGKGLMQTYWVDLKSKKRRAKKISAESAAAAFTSPEHDSCDSFLTDSGGESTDDDSEMGSASFRMNSSGIVNLDPKDLRLVDWNSDNLQKYLKRVVHARSLEDRGQHSTLSYEVGEESAPDQRPEEFDLRSASKIIDDVTEVIRFPVTISVDAMIKNDFLDADELDLDVKEQLHDYMTRIACLYGENANPFHSFAHSSHVAMAVMSWLQRAVPPQSNDSTTEMIQDFEDSFSGDWKPSVIPRNAYTLISDPLTQFALLFAALIHDCGHKGLPNVELVRQEDQLASQYDNRSIHEQNALHLAFDVLMESKYSSLRCAIYGDRDEFVRFRQVVINAVLATDILDDGVTGQQSVRWGCTFKGQEDINKSQKEMINQSRSNHSHNHHDDDSIDAASESEASALENLPDNEEDIKASILIEHLLVVADIAHTMQHWFVYRKWNQMLFEELYMAYISGRGEKDPSTTWYKDELEFFDDFVIPMASKMKDCGLFDISNEDFLAHAESNREQWKNQGKREIAKMLSNIPDFHASSSLPTKSSQNSLARKSSQTSLARVSSHSGSSISRN